MDHGCRKEESEEEWDGSCMHACRKQCSGDAGDVVFALLLLPLHLLVVTRGSRQTVGDDGVLRRRPNPIEDNPNLSMTLSTAAGFVEKAATNPSIQHEKKKKSFLTTQGSRSIAVASG